MASFAGRTLLQVTPRLNEGGVERTTVDIAQAFAAAGGRSLVASEGGRLAPALVSHGVEVVKLPLASKNPWVIRRNRDRLVQLIREEQVDLVHARSRAPAWSAYWACRETGVPLVTTYHGIYSGRSALKTWYNSVMARGQVVIANSEFTRRHVLAAHQVDPARVVTVNRGVDLAEFSSPSQARIETLAASWGELHGTVFLLAARLTEWKGQRLAIEAIKALQRPATLVIAGEGKETFLRELRRMAPPNVRFVGHVQDMAAAYSIADFVIAPSLRPEAFGRTAVEPQALGTPVIASDHGAPAETIIPGQTGWLVRPGDAASWSAAMDLACRMPAEARNEIGAAGRARVEALFTNARMCSETLQIYEGILGAAA